MSKIITGADAKKFVENVHRTTNENYSITVLSDVAVVKDDITESRVVSGEPIVILSRRQLAILMGLCTITSFKAYRDFITERVADAECRSEIEEIAKEVLADAELARFEDEFRYEWTGCVPEGTVQDIVDKM